MAEKKTHNIVTFDLDDQIVAVHQMQTGAADYSASVRMIIRDWARISGLSALMGYSSVDVTQEYIKAAKKSEGRKPRKRVSRKKLAEIPGVSKGMVN